MRIVMNQYADGDKFAVETATDGSVVKRDLIGQRKVGARISAYVEVACDDNEQGLERLKESLELLTKEVEQRLREELQKHRAQPASA
jgi:hypothetical protein